MAYEVSFDGPLLVVRLSGTVTGADLDAATDAVLSLEESGRTPRPRLTDVRDVTEPAIGYADIARVAERARTRPLVDPIRSAIVVKQPVQLGFARMFQILNEHPQITVHIFDDERAARTWLLSGLRKG